MRNRQFLDDVFKRIEHVPTIVMEASDFTAVLAQVASGNAATIAPQDVAETFLAQGTTIQLPLVEPAVSQTIGLSIKDQKPPLADGSGLAACGASFAITKPDDAFQ